MAAIYDISITDLKVVVKTTNGVDVSIDTYARDSHKSKLDKGIVRFVNMDTNANVLNISNIATVNSITDYRGGVTVAIAVPATIDLLYTEVIEDKDAPFFFESFKADAAGAVEVTNSDGNPIEIALSEGNTSSTGDNGTSYVGVEDNPNGATLAALDNILEEIKETNRILTKIYN